MSPDGFQQVSGRRVVPTPWRRFARTFGFYNLAQSWPRRFYDSHLQKQPLRNSPIDTLVNRWRLTK